MRETRQDDTPYADTDEDDIYREEVEDVINSLKNKNAKSNDKIPKEAMRAIFEVIGEEIVSFYSDWIYLEEPK